MFREPERRPPAFVSNLFTGLCLAPVLLLLILWARLAVNISNFPLSLSAVTFHLGLGGKYQFVNRVHLIYMNKLLISMQMYICRKAEK